MNDFENPHRKTEEQLSAAYWRDATCYWIAAFVVTNVLWVVLALTHVI